MTRKSARHSTREHGKHAVPKKLTEQEILDVFERLGLSEEYKRAAYRALGGQQQQSQTRRRHYFLRFSSSTG